MEDKRIKEISAQVASEYWKTGKGTIESFIEEGIRYALSEAKIISSNLPVIKSVCRCKEGKTGREVDENYHQICEVCGGY